MDGKNLITEVQEEGVLFILQTLNSTQSFEHCLSMLLLVSFFDGDFD